MVGLKNQGATCYLNSLLQSLYFTNAFRKVSVTSEDPESLLIVGYKGNLSNSYAARDRQSQKRLGSATIVLSTSSE